MDELERAIVETWKRIGPSVLADPAELAKRLARRRTQLLSQPPRAWCLAVRANDHRINQQTALVTRSHRLDSAGRQSSEVSHLVQLDAALLKELCAPVHIDPPGEDAHDVAKKLGVSVHGLWTARFRGVFHAHHVRRLSGKRGKPVPVLYTDRELDPATPLFTRPDPLWVWTAGSLLKKIPPRLQQTLTRVPTYQPRTPLGPIDRPRRPSQKLPPPAPDHVWYKWSNSNVYLGDDPKFWRKSPDDPGIPPAPGEVRRAPWLRPPRSPRPTPHSRRTSSSSIHFRGYLWLCPACHKKVRTLYYPLPAIDLLSNRGPDVPPLPRALFDFDAIEKPGATFACQQCHRIAFNSRVSPAVWNRLIAQLSAGLLYGQEVPKPSWFKPTRKLPFRPRPMSRPSKHREDVFQAMLQGHSFTTIAKSLALRYGDVATCAHQLYQQHHVHTRADFARVTNSPLPPKRTFPRPTQTQVLHRLRAGEDFKTIAKPLNKTPKVIRLAAHKLYRRFGVHSVAELRRALRSPHAPLTTP